MTVFFAGRQEVRAQDAVAAATAAAEAATPPLRVEAIGAEWVPNPAWLFTDERRVDWPSLMRVVNGPNPDAAAESLARSSGGLPVDAVIDDGRLTGFSQHWRFTVAGTRSEPTLLTSVRLRTEACQPPIHGGILGPRVGGYGASGGPRDVERIGFDLDSADLEARTVDDRGIVSPRRYLARRQVTVAVGEMVTFSVTVAARTRDCAYVLELVTSKGFVLRVDDSKKPWRLSGPAAKYARSAAYDPQVNRYVLSP